MKRKDIQELRNKTKGELAKLLMEERGSLVKLRMELKTAKVKNVRWPARRQDDIARILTIMEEKNKVKEEK